MEPAHTDSTDSSSGNNSRGVIFLLGLASVSAFAGFGYTLSTARKVDPIAFSEGLRLISTSSTNYNRPESGIRLALRAFGCASLITVSGVGCLTALVWMCTGAHSWQDFNKRISNLFPKSWRLEAKDIATNFKTFDELYSYINCAAPSDKSYQSTNKD